MKTSNPSGCTCHKDSPTALEHQVSSGYLIDHTILKSEVPEREGKRKERICLPSLGCSRYPTRPSHVPGIPRMSRLALGSGTDMRLDTDMRQLLDPEYLVCFKLLTLSYLSGSSFCLRRALTSCWRTGIPLDDAKKDRRKKEISGKLGKEMSDRREE